MQDFFCNIGERRLVVSPQKITIKKMKDIQNKMAEIQAKYSPYAKVPRLEGEKAEEWYSRYLEFLGESAKRKDGESNESFMARTFKPVSAEENLQLLYDTLLMIAIEFDQADKVTPESFESIVYEEVSKFICSVLKRAKVSTKEFELEE